MAKLRNTDAEKLTSPGRRRSLRPASPYVPMALVLNAAVLNHCRKELAPAGRPLLALIWSQLSLPIPVSELSTPLRQVNGNPVCPTISAFTCHPFTIARRPRGPELNVGVS